MVYTGNCLDECNTGRFAFKCAIDKHNNYCGQSAPYQVDSRPVIRLGNDGKLDKGRFVMSDNTRNDRDEKGRFTKGSHWRKPKPYWVREWLYNEYVIRQRSARDIALEFGCRVTNIFYFLEKHQIHIRTISEVRAIKHWGQSGKDNPMYGKRGSEVPAWKGGSTPDRQDFYSSIEWRKASATVWRRDKGVCRRCGKIVRTREGFHVHHIVSFQVKELRTDINNLVLLCPECHRWVHSTKNTNGDFIKEYNQEGNI